MGLNSKKIILQRLKIIQLWLYQEINICVLIILCSQPPGSSMPSPGSHPTVLAAPHSASGLMPAIDCVTDILNNSIDSRNFLCIAFADIPLSNIHYRQDRLQDYNLMKIFSTGMDRNYCSAWAKANPKSQYLRFGLKMNTKVAFNHQPPQ